MATPDDEVELSVVPEEEDHSTTNGFISAEKKLEKLASERAEPTAGSSSSDTPIGHADEDHGALPPTPPLPLVFRDLRYSILLPGGQRKEILCGVSAAAQPGRMLAIMGPTGCGKTSLLNCLAGRSPIDSGDIYVGGKPRTKAIRRKIAYIMQDDVLFDNLTVRQTLTYTALLRSPRHMARAEKLARVDYVIKKLNLTKCQHTMVGSAFRRGVSGGERKRTNIGNELMTNPAMIMLDEPTSGLDSSTALSLIETLRSFSNLGRTIVCTIHQPSSQMFHMFDDVLLLARGYPIYQGPPSGIVPYFSSLGHPCKPHYNPADFMLELVTDEELRSATPVVSALIEEYPKHHQLSADIGDSAPSIDEPEEEEGPRWPTTFSQQFLILTGRSLRQQKTKILSKFTFAQVMLVGLIIGFLWFQTPTKEDAIQDRIGVIFFIVAFWTFIPCFTALLNFPPERGVISRERAAGSYRLSAYFFSKTIAGAALRLIFPLIFCIMVYWMVGLNPGADRFFIFLLIICSQVLLGQSLGLSVSTAIHDFEKAITFLSVYVLASMLAGGFYVKSDNIPIWFRWVQWISVMRYSFEAALINDFKNGPTYDKVDGASFQYDSYPVEGDAILDQQQLSGIPLWGLIPIVWGWAIIFRCIAYLNLRLLHRPIKGV